MKAEIKNLLTRIRSKVDIIAYYPSVRIKASIEIASIRYCLDEIEKLLNQEEKE